MWGRATAPYARPVRPSTALYARAARPQALSPRAMEGRDGAHWLQRVIASVKVSKVLKSASALLHACRSELKGLCDRCDPIAFCLATQPGQGLGALNCRHFLAGWTMGITGSPWVVFWQHRICSCTLSLAVKAQNKLQSGVRTSCVMRLSGTCQLNAETNPVWSCPWAL